MIKGYQGKPSKIFEKWKDNKDFNNDRDVATAILSKWKTRPSNPQLNYLSRVLEMEKTVLKAKFGEERNK